MPKKKRTTTGLSGNPAKRSQQLAQRETERATQQPPKLSGSVSDPDLEARIAEDRAVHMTLASRGWSVRDHFDYWMWEWPPTVARNSYPNFRATGEYLVATVIIATTQGYRVDLTGNYFGGVPIAHYKSLTDLAGDLDSIESFRADQPTPALPHADMTDSTIYDPAADDPEDRESNFTWFDDQADQSLTSRGWRAHDDEFSEFDGHIWRWPPSAPEKTTNDPFGSTGTWAETLVRVREDGYKGLITNEGVAGV